MSQFSLVTGFFEGTRQNILHIFRALDNKFWLFQVIFVLQYMMRFSTVFEIIYRIMLGHSCLKVATLISKCHLKKPKIMLLVGLLFSIGTIIFEKIICRMYKCTLQYLKPKCDNVKISSGEFLSWLLTISQSNSEEVWCKI